MVMIAVECPSCKGTNVSRNGSNRNGKKRYICNDKTCAKKSFILDYTYNGRKPGIEEKIINMAANASGIRDTARVLKISKQKVSDTLKKLKNPSAK